MYTLSVKFIWFAHWKYETLLSWIILILASRLSWVNETYFSENFVIEKKTKSDSDKITVNSTPIESVNVVETYRFS